MIFFYKDKRSEGTKRPKGYCYSRKTENSYTAILILFFPSFSDKNSIIIEYSLPLSSGRKQTGRKQAGRKQSDRKQAGRKQAGRKQPGRKQPGRKQPFRKQPGRKQPGRKPGGIQRFSLAKSIAE